METKWCHGCKEIKTIDNFCRNRHHKDGLGSMCRPCVKVYNKKYREKNINKLNEYNKQWKKKNTDTNYNRRVKLKHKYGITVEQYDLMYTRQNGVCAICDGINENGQRLHIDHDHQTGKVRGLLCMRCNLNVAVIENKDFIERVKCYLKEYSY